jgi:hypothetical protein
MEEEKCGTLARPDQSPDVPPIVVLKQARTPLVSEQAPVAEPDMPLTPQLIGRPMRADAN